jgi:four helix bundle protein
MFRFEKFEVWQQSVGFADKVYACTRGFPRDEQFGLTSQMRRAAVSVSSNIAEGSSRLSDKEFARFVEIAYGSLMEVISQMFVATRQSLIDQPQCDQIYSDAEHIARKLSALRNTLDGSKGSG